MAKTEERIQKILSQVGIASRRRAEEMILEGDVTVNGKVAQLGDKATWGKDAIKVRGKLIHQKNQAPLYVAFYKPKGVISAMVDPEDRPTLANYLSKIKTRIFPIDRLDFITEGLVLLTNDGDFSEKLQKRDDIPRIYHVKVKGHPEPDLISRLEKGARLGENSKRVSRPYSVRLVEKLQNKSVIEVVTLGGKAFDLKELFTVKGFLVDKVVRTAIGHISLNKLLPGHYRLLKNSQIEALLEQPELGIRHLEKKSKGDGFKVDL